MSDAMRNQLEQAYNLIQNDRLDDAVGLLRPIVRADPNNPDAWWLLANAVSDPNDAFEALDNVLRLEPEHEQARDLLNNLLQEYPELASRSAHPSSTTSSGVRSASNIAPTPTDSNLDTNWDTQFGEAGTQSFSANADPVAPNNELDDFFSTLDPASATVSDFDSPTDSYEAGFADDSFGQSAGTKRATTEADLDSLFNTDDDAEDMDTLFAQGRELETTNDVNADNDLDAMFATSTSNVSDRGSENALQDPFGVSEPDFLQDLDSAPVAAPAEQKRGRGKSSKVSTRTSGAIPAQDPFAAEAGVNQGRRSRTMLIGLVAIVVLAGVLIAIALLRPFTTPPDTSVTATVDLALNNGTGQPGITDVVQQALTGINFTDPKVTIANDKLSVTVCEKPGRNLRTRFSDAIKALANTAIVVSKQVGNAELELVNCSQSNARLYRASAPMTALVAYNADKDLTKYLTAWVQN
jgi:hypothetical protein